MDNRFEKLLQEKKEIEMDEEDGELVGEFFSTALELASEISKRGAEGGNISQAEKKFITKTMMVALTVMMKKG